jgi:hypothetical protein
MSLFKKLLKRSLSDFFRKRKKGLIAFSIMMLVLFGLNYFTNRYIDRVVGNVIMEFVDEKSEGFYHIEFDEIGYVINNGRFKMTGFRFDIDPVHQKNLNLRQLPQNYLYQAEIPVLNINIADVWSVFIRKKLRVTGIEIISPAIKITNLNKNKEPKKISFEAGNLYKALSEHLIELKINDFVIVDGRFDYETLDGPDYDNFHVKGLSFSVENFLLNNSSASQDGKFFYTDDISLEIKNQVLLLKDSIHKVEFDKFYISTQANKLGFHNLRLTRRDNPLADKLQRDHYEISLPDLRFSGVDFLSAYNDNFLFIDSIEIDQPEIDLVHRNKNAPRDSKRNNLLDLFMIYHDYFEVNHFILHDASLKIRDETQSKPSKYAIDHIGAVITEIKIDTVKNSLRPYDIDFNHVDLVIKDYEMLLPDSMNTIKFAKLSISSNPNIIILKDLFIQPDSTAASDHVKLKILAGLPYTVIKGFDIGKFINQDSLIISEVYIEQPDIEIISITSEHQKRDVLTPGGLFGLTDKINSFSRLFQIDKLMIADGKLSFTNHERNIEVALNKTKLEIENLKFDHFTSYEDQFLLNAGINFSTEESRVQTDDLSMDAGKIAFGSIQGRLNIENLHLVTGKRNAEIQSEFTFSDIGISGINLDEILMQQKFLVDTFRMTEGRAILNIYTNEQLTNSHKSTEHPLPAISVKNLVFDNTLAEVKSQDETIITVAILDMDISAFSLDQSLSHELKNQFDYQRINNISASDYTMFLIRQDHLLQIEEIELTDNDAITIKNFNLFPSGKPANEYKVMIPQIQMRGMDFKQILKESYYSGREIIIENPDINLKLTQSRKEKITSLDLVFMPLLLRNKLSGIGTDTLAITDAKFRFYQKTADDSLKLECDRFDFSVHNFSIDSTTEMLPGRFLFANDVLMNGEYVSLYQPGQNNFFNVNHFRASTKEQDIHLEGVYVATNIKNENDSIGQVKLSIDHLNISDLNFFNLTQHRKLDLAQIKIDNAKLNYAPAAWTENSNAPSKSDKSIIPNNTSTEKSGQIMDKINYFGESIALPATKPTKRKIHELKYLFDTMLLKSVRIDRILITDSQANLENAIEHKIDLALPEIWFLAEGISYNPVSARDSIRIFYSDRIMTRLSNLNYIFPDNMNAVRINELVINSQDSTIKVKNFQLDPLVSKYDYGTIKGFQSTWMRLNNDSIVLRNVDFLEILNHKNLRASTVSFHKLDFEIYRDKRVPFPEWQRRPLPQVELKGVDFTFNIDTIAMNNSYIGYLEHAEKSNAAGEVFFNDVNAMVVNFTNDTASIAKNPKTNISATAMVFGKGKVTAQFQFDMLNPENIHTYGVEVDSFDLTEFNRILIPNASAQVRSGKNHRIVMTAKANEQYSYGEMRFYYNDLRVQLLNPETELPRGLGNVLGSFFANTFIIRTNNPKNFVLRKGDIFFERDEKRAIFNYWTKTFLSGVISSIGATNNKKKIEKMHEEYLKGLEQKKSEEITLHN